MAGVTPNEGRALIGSAIYNGGSITSFSLVLMTNAGGTLSATSVAADITQPTGGVYVALAIPRSGWTVGAAGDVTRSTVVWTAVGSAYAQQVTGAALIAITPGGNVLMHYQYDPVPKTIAQGGTYFIDLLTIIG